MKIRVIPSILTDGVSQVKGEKFDNWRTVGSVMQAVRVHSRRDVDEIVLLDVNASKEGRVIDAELVSEVASFLRVPLTVGGGISSIDDVSRLLSAGADKVIIGTAAVLDDGLISDLSREFGAQALVVSIDVIDAQHSPLVAVFSGTKILETTPVELSLEMVKRGAGELLVQSVDRDGTLRGLDTRTVAEICAAVSVPVLASSGLASPENAVDGAKAGASGIVAGAILQFTEVTPASIKNALGANGFDVRR